MSISVNIIATIKYPFNHANNSERCIETFEQPPAKQSVSVNLTKQCKIVDVEKREVTIIMVTPRVML